LCEDTRTTGKLLAHYAIKNKTQSYHSHTKLAKLDLFITMIREGKNLALVSDAGTPCISDPGVMLVAKLREEFGNDFKVIAIPGASALVSALSISGLPAHEFTWKGFVPHKKGRETFFTDISNIETTVIFYESVHRFLKTLESLAEKIPNRNICVARELTKMFEETVNGTTVEVLEYFQNNPDKVRGEFVIVVGPR
jgi:16S rRNA (cytidine1402-2'-O)-methyltransferase